MRSGESLARLSSRFVVVDSSVFHTFCSEIDQKAYWKSIRYGIVLGPGDMDIVYSRQCYQLHDHSIGNDEIGSPRPHDDAIIVYRLLHFSGEIEALPFHLDSKTSLINELLESVA